MNSHNFETLAHLKNFLNSLNEDELKQPVRFWGEEIGGTISGADILEEDYINPSGEGCEPISAYKDEEDFEDYKDEPVALPKGAVVFYCERGNGAAKYFDKCPTCEAPVNIQFVPERNIVTNKKEMVKTFKYYGK